MLIDGFFFTPCREILFVVVQTEGLHIKRRWWWCGGVQEFDIDHILMHIWYHLEETVKLSTE